MYKLPESVLVVVHTADLQVLLLERADATESRWQSVTGSREPTDADLAATARREVLEETGLDLAAPAAQGTELRDWCLRNRYEIWPAWRARYAPDVTHNVEHVFGLTLPAPFDVRLDPAEHRAFVWLPWQDAAQRCFSPTNRDAIGLLPARLAAAQAAVRQ
jgi:dihydroneopterin triphosphate diphosphatase